MAMTITMVATIIGTGVVAIVMWNSYDKEKAEREKAERLAEKHEAKMEAWEEERAELEAQAKKSA